MRIRNTAFALIILQRKLPDIPFFIRGSELLEADTMHYRLEVAERFSTSEVHYIRGSVHYRGSVHKRFSTIEAQYIRDSVH